MRFETEHKISHREWDEISILPRDFFVLFEKFFREDDNGEAVLETHNYLPTFHFERGEVFADEMWWVDNGKIATSSDRGGVTGWWTGNEYPNQYVHEFYGRARPLGQFVKAVFILDDDLNAALETI